MRQRYLANIGREAELTARKKERGDYDDGEKRSNYQVQDDQAFFSTQFFFACPANNAVLINFRLSSDAEILPNKHWLSIQIGAKRAKMCVHCAYISTELPFCIPPLVVGYCTHTECRYVKAFLPGCLMNAFIWLEVQQNSAIRCKAPHQHGNAFYCLSSNCWYKYLPIFSCS